MNHLFPVSLYTWPFRLFLFAAFCLYTSALIPYADRLNQMQTHIYCVCVLFDFIFLYPAKELPVIYSSA
jgi:hypothetical protein